MVVVGRFMSGLREKYVVEIEYARELYARGATPSVLAQTVETLGVVGTISMIVVAREVWGLGLAVLKGVAGYEPGRGVINERAFDGYINAALAHGIADGTAHRPGALQTLTLAPAERDDAGNETVRIVVDDIELRERVYADELAMSSDDAVADAFALPTRQQLVRVLGETGEDVVVLDCGCGSEGCWPLKMRVTIGAVAVVWDAFARPRRHHGLRFVFDRAAYDRALATLE